MDVFEAQRWIDEMTADWSASTLGWIALVASIVGLIARFIIKRTKTKKDDRYAWVTDVAEAEIRHLRDRAEKREKGK